jgi:DNA-binding Lrp family transcriptional regulator
MQLDELDVKILDILQVDGRIALTRLSARLDVPHTTVRDRLKKLEEAGAIERYAAILDPARLGLPISAFVMITLDQRLAAAPAVAALLEIDEVGEAFLLTGDVDILARIWARDVEHLRQILYEKLSSVPGLVRTNTVVVLASQAGPGRLPLVPAAGQAPPRTEP